MPFPVRWLVRGLQLMGKSRQDCGRLLGDGWLRRGPGFFLMGERGGDARHTGRHAEVSETMPTTQDFVHSLLTLVTPNTAHLTLNT